MTNATAADRRGWSGRTIGAALLAVAGLALASYGSYLHLTIAARVSAGACDGCAPWHPLFVVAPLIVGTAAVLLGGYGLVRR